MAHTKKQKLQRKYLMAHLAFILAFLRASGYMVKKRKGVRTCSKCGMTFTSKKALAKHYKGHHGGKKAKKHKGKGKKKKMSPKLKRFLKKHHRFPKKGELR